MSHRAPFPYFGGKSMIADAVWDALGDCKAYFEPFCGSCAVLLARPHEYDPASFECINDIDGEVTNFWRSIRLRPAETWDAAQRPVLELDLHAERRRMLDTETTHIEKMRADPDYCDPVRAGTWCWGMSASVGKSFVQRSVVKALPHVTNTGAGICRVGYTRGVWDELAARMARVRVSCGAWERLCNPAVMWAKGLGMTGVFLDPPYAADRDDTLYRHDSMAVSQEVAAWCRQVERTRNLRIVLAGYDGEHDLPGWRVIEWQASGGYANQGDMRRENKHRERLYLSPNCLNDRQMSLI